MKKKSTAISSLSEVIKTAASKSCMLWMWCKFKPAGLLDNTLSNSFGKGFDASNLRYMRLFYQAFPNCDALRSEFSWTNFLSVD